MDFIFIFLLALMLPVFGLAIFSSIIAKKNTLNELFQETAREYNLEFRRGSFLSNPLIKGICDGVSLLCSICTMNKQTGISIQANPVSYLPFKIYMTTETTLTRLKSMIGMSDIQTGDMEFDNKMLIKGPEAGVITMLNKKACSLILNLVDNAMEFEISTYHFDIIFSKENQTASSLISKIKQIIDLAHELNRARDLKTLAEYNIRNDLYASVRKRNLEILIEHYEHVPPEIEDILNSCLEDRAWEVSITAAPYLGEKGRDHLIKLLLQSPLKGKIAAVKTMAQFRDSVCGTALKSHFAHTNSLDVKLEILKTFRQYGDPELNDFLLNLISDPDTDTRIAVHVVKALGTCGALSSVKVLHNFINHSKPSPRLKSAIKQTITEIHARLAQGEEAGRLSVSEIDTGQGSLSMADNA